MTKKSLNPKEAQKFVTESRINGKNDQEIYNELTQQYYDKKAVALLITGTVRPQEKEKYKMLNNVLIGLLIYSTIIKILVFFNLTLQSGHLWLMLLILIVPLINLFFIYEIARFNGPMYRVCGLLTIAGFFQTVGKSENTTDVITSLIFTIAVAGLSFYLDAKMFPRYSRKKLKTDSKGDYILV